MKPISFPYETKTSPIFKSIKRPVAEVSFWSAGRKRWLKYTLIVDTGADYTVFPLKVAQDLKINAEKECKKFLTRGVGGSEKVFIYKKGLRMKLGDYETKIPVGFLERNDLPPLLGRQECLDIFEVLFSNFMTSFKK